MKNKNYKAGTYKFYIDTDTNGILMELKTLHDSGKMKHIKLKVHFHSGNAVGIANMRAIVEHNHKWMEEV